MRDIGKNIRQLRDRENMTQDELAQKLFVTRQTVSNYENGKSRPDVEMLERIAEVLHTDIQTVIYGPQPRRLPGIFMACILAVVMGFLLLMANSYARRWMVQSFSLGYLAQALFILWPAYFVFLGWIAAALVGMMLKWKPKNRKGLNWAGWVLAGLLAVCFFLMVLEFYVPQVRWVNRVMYAVYVFTYRIRLPYYFMFLLPGAALWLLGFPRK